MAYYDFPHTRNYDTDLGYLIQKYQELLDEFNNINVNGLKEDVEILKADDNTNKQNIATNTYNINNHTTRITALENADFLTNVKINNSDTIQVTGGEKVDGVQTYTINVIGSQPANLTSNLTLLNNDSELPIVKSSVISLDTATNKIKLAITSYVNGSETTSETTINLSQEEFKILDNTLMLAKNYLEVSTAEELLNQKQDKLISGTNIKTINGNSVLGEGDMKLPTLDNISPLIAYPIGSVYFSMNNTNPSDILGGGTWELIGSKLAVKENVVGNGYTLGITDGTKLFGLGPDGGGDYSKLNAVTGNYGKLLGSSQSGNPIVTFSAGIPTAEQLGANPEYSGLIVVTESIYSWKRIS